MKLCYSAKFVLLLFSLQFIGLGCGSKTILKPSTKTGGLLSGDIKSEIEEMERSVVGVFADVDYDIYKMNYAVEDGQLIPDPKSPYKYKLSSKNGDTGVTLEKDEQTKTGGGLIVQIDKERSTYIILTSSHLVAPKDTVDVYYVDEEGAQTDALFARYVVKGVKVHVRGASSWRSRAEVIASDERYDVALIKVQIQTNLGFKYPNPVDLNQELGWGDWVFLFGYPKGIKQLTGGWVSPSPYPNTLAVDAVIRKGYSGGPLFAIRQDVKKTKLIFVGLIKSVPFTMLNFVTLQHAVPEGHQLKVEDLNRLVVENMRMVDYGTAYFVSPEGIKKFFLANRSAIERSGVQLDGSYYAK